MNIEHPLAYSFILQDDIYLLPADKQAFRNMKPALPATIVTTETPVPVFKYLGRNKNQYLVVTHYSDSDFIAGAHLTALESTLKRLGVEPDDTAIFNLAYHPGAQFKEIIDFFKPQKMLILGHLAFPPAMGAIDKNKPGEVSNIRALFTFSFNEMMDSVENKKQFWEAMKQF